MIIEPSEEWQEGCRDYWDRDKPYTNPYEIGTTAYDDYDSGWDAAMLEDEMTGKGCA